MATSEMWPEVLELRGDHEISFNQHQDRTLLTINQHQNQVSILINEDSSKDSSKILVEMSEDEFFTITNSETQNRQNEFFQTSENELQCDVTSRTTLRKSGSELNWMTPISTTRQPSSTEQSLSKNV